MENFNEQHFKLELA